jgi:hypothetical protein
MLKSEKTRYQQVYDWVQESRKKKEELKTLEKAVQDAEKALAELAAGAPSFGSVDPENAAAAAAAAAAMAQYAAAAAAAQAAAAQAKAAYTKAQAEYAAWVKDTDTAIASMNESIVKAEATTQQLAARLRDIPGKLNELYNAAGAFDGSFTSWDATANKTDTDFGDLNRKDIENSKSTKAADDINEKSVDALRQRTENMLSLLDTMHDEAQSMQYGGVPITSIRSLADADSATYGEYNFSSSYSGAVSALTIDAANNPNIEVSKPDLYQWLNAQKFADIDETKNKEAKKSFSDIKTKGDKGNAEAEQTKADANRIPLANMTDLVGADYPSAFDHKNDGVLVGAKDILANIVKLTRPADLIRDSRDALFATAYVKGMFSWYTYEYEGKYSLLSDPDKKNIKVSTAEEIYKKYEGELAERHKWQSTDKRDFYNKTLTNYMISPKNNYLYGGELEYILYGDTNEKNINTALTIIWAIRYALNVPSAFASFWLPVANNATSMLIEELSLSICLATGGIIPEALVKTVFILALTVFETIHDMQMLKLGLPVKFIKGINDEDWYMRFEKLGEFSAEVSDGEKTGIHIEGPSFTYGDYLSFFLILGFSGDTHSKALYLRTADLMQANIRTTIGGIGTDYKLSRACTYFKLDAQVRAKPLMLALPIAFDYTNGKLRFKDWCTYDYSAVRGYT